MALPRLVDFVDNTIVSSAFLNRIQEMISAISYNVKPVIQSPTSVRVPGGAGPGAAALISINGELRYNEANADVAFTGGDGAGTYGIFAITGSDPAFTLTKVLGAGTPGVADYRKIATVDWSGSALSNLVYSVDLQLPPAGLADASVTGAKLVDTPIIGTSKLIDDAVTAAKLANNAVDTAAIVNLAVTGAKIADATITSDKFAPGAVGGATVEDSSITSAKIADGAIVNVDVNAAAGIVYSKLSLNNSIVNADIAAAAAIAYSKLNLTNSIVAADLTTGAVTSAKILDGTIVAGDLADGAVTSVKILDGTIVAGDLADGAVTSAKILDGTIVNADLNAAAAIARSKLDFGSGLVNADIAAGAAIVYSKLNLSNSIVAGDITSNAITNAKLADASVGTTELIDANVTSAKLASGLTLAGTTTTVALTSTGAHTVTRTSSADVAHSVKLTASAHPQFLMRANGDLEFGRGDVAADAYLQYEYSQTLKLFNRLHIDAQGGAANAQALWITASDAGPTWPIHVQNNNTVNLMILNDLGALYTKGAMTPNGLDYAEWFPAEEPIDPGDVVGLNTSTGRVRPYQTGDVLVGVGSTTPAIAVGGPAREAGEDPGPGWGLVGLVGQVPVASAQVTITGRVVSTSDGKRIGYQLADNNVYLNLETA